MNIFDEDCLGRIIIYYKNMSSDILAIGIEMDCGNIFRIPLRNRYKGYYTRSKLSKHKLGYYRKLFRSDLIFYGTLNDKK